MNANMDAARTLRMADPGTDLRAVALREDQLRLGLWMFLATVTMLFSAFTSAYIVRRSGSDWRALTLPPQLWLNTLVLLASSVALEGANRLGSRGRWAQSTWAFGAALAGGVVFLAGQVRACRELADAGMYLQTNPHSSFFYMLTGVHALHVVAALAVLAWGLASTRSGARDPRAWAARMGTCRTFWHFLGAVWIWLFALVTFL
jgi:cytochrome c oxidase subunit 3